MCNCPTTISPWGQKVVYVNKIVLKNHTFNKIKWCNPVRYCVIYRYDRNKYTKYCAHIRKLMTTAFTTTTTASTTTDNDNSN